MKAEYLRFTFPVKKGELQFPLISKPADNLVHFRDAHSGTSIAIHVKNDKGLDEALKEATKNAKKMHKERIAFKRVNKR